MFKVLVIRALNLYHLFHHKNHRFPFAYNSLLYCCSFIVLKTLDFQFKYNRKSSFDAIRLAYSKLF